MKRLVIVGNCQVDAYKKLLKAGAIDGWGVDAIEVWRHKPDEFDRLATQVSEADIVITQPLSAHYQGLETAELRSHSRNLLVIHNLYFRGYHPDCVYVGPMGARIKSPVGDYHSQVVHSAWQAGKTVSEAIQLLTDYPVSLAQEIYSESLKELMAREEEVSVPISQRLQQEDGWKLFYTFNHPTLELHKYYLTEMLRELEIKASLADIPDPLQIHTQWPIYPSVGTVLGLSEKARHQDLFFIPSRSISDGKVGLEDFCSHSYQIYDQSAS